MRSSVQGIAWLMTFSFLLLSCGSLKEKDKTTVLRNERQVMRALESQELNMQYIKARASGRWSDEYGSQGFSIQLRMQKDRAIWVSASKLGFELARVLVRPDSVFFMNRLSSEYFAKPLDYLKEICYPLSFRDLQQLLIGRPLQPVRAYALTERDTNLYRLKSVRDNPGLTEEYILKEPGPLIRNMFWTDNLDRSVQAELSEYQEITDNKIFSYFRVYKLLGLADDEPTLKLKFKEVILDEPVSTPFRIPPSYSKME